MFKTRRTITAALVATAALAVGASSAQALTTPQVVAGVPANALAIGVATPTVFLTGFQPGSTATGSGLVLVTSTLPNWTLTVQDNTGNAGALGKAGGAVVPATGVPVVDGLGVPVVCPAGSQAKTNHAMTIAGSGLLPTTSGSSAGAISGGAHTVATGALTDTINATFSLAVDSNELLSSTCLYNTTLTYTVQ
jgi:hypothetical protein